MTQDGNSVDSNNPATVTEGQTSQIVCTAYGGRPVVEIMWEHQMKGGGFVEITTGVSQTNTSTGDDTFNVVSTLEYTPSNKDYNEGGIRCVVPAQIATTEMSATAALSVQCKCIIIAL